MRSVPSFQGSLDCDANIDGGRSRHSKNKSMTKQQQKLDIIDFGVLYNSSLLSPLTSLSAAMISSVSRGDPVISG